MPPPRRAAWYCWEELAEEQLNDLLSRRLITGDRLMLAHVYLKKGCIVPRHAHENEQFTYILEGALRFLVGENVPHEAHALEDTLDVDVFSPPRQDWLSKTDSYLRQK